VRIDGDRLQQSLYTPNKSNGGFGIDLPPVAFLHEKGEGEISLKITYQVHILSDTRASSDDREADAKKEKFLSNVDQ